LSASFPAHIMHHITSYHIIYIFTNSKYAYCYEGGQIRIAIRVKLHEFRI